MNISNYNDYLVIKQAEQAKRLETPTYQREAAIQELDDAQLDFDTDQDDDGSIDVSSYENSWMNAQVGRSW